LKGVKKVKVLLILPAYNESGNLPKLFDKLRNSYFDYDILVVNDCSTDETLQVCKDYKIPVVSLPINIGIGGAVQTGFKYAYANDYDIAVQVDGDGQHNPYYIKNLIDEIKSGANVCIGSRFIDKNGFQSTFIRRVGIRFFQCLIRLVTRTKFTDPTSGFRAFDREIIKFFSKDYPCDYPEPESIVMVLREKYKVTEIPVIMNEREQGQSSISFRNSIYYIIKVSISLLITNKRKRRD